MNKITRNIAALIAFGIGTTTIGFAQITQQKIGDNPTIINPNAALQVDSASKGFLLPRLALTATNNFAPLTAHVAGMTVYNTVTAGVAPNNVTPGYYYNDGTQWVRIATGADAKTEPWFDQTTNTEATTNTQNIYQMGNVAIGATTAPSFPVGATTVQPKLHIAGDVSTTGKYYTTNSVYADYVFEKYFNGSSNINPNYEFKSLNYVKEFIKANNHLPGVESINDLNKAENGYTFDMTKLTVQSLEKIEELYLHTIEQQDKIDTQQEEIQLLKKQVKETEERLQRLENILVD